MDSTSLSIHSVSSTGSVLFRRERSRRYRGADPGADTPVIGRLRLELNTGRVSRCNFFATPRKSVRERITAISLRTMSMSPIGVETDSSSGIMYLREAITMAPWALYCRGMNSAAMKAVAINGSTINAMSPRRRQIDAKTSNTVVLCDAIAAGDSGIGTGSAISVELGPRVTRQRSMSSCLMISTATLFFRSSEFGFSRPGLEACQDRAATDQR